MNLIEQAFTKVRRRDFVPEELRDMSELDVALPIGHSQTISQPTTVRRMLEWLNAQPGDKILDVGSGSGWTAALLAYIAGPKGKVIAVERIPELLEFGRSNCKKARVTNVKFFQAEKEYGLQRYATYDRILVSAAAEKFPMKLLDQLKNSGKLVIPVSHDILEITKTSASDFELTKHAGYVFVPLV